MAANTAAVVLQGQATSQTYSCLCLNCSCVLFLAQAPNPCTCKAVATLPAHLQVEGLFWNYFSIGMDATAAYGFHHLRETKPWAAPSRMVNQAWYAYYGCSSGWFCCAKPIRNTVTLKVRRGAMTV